MKNLFCFESCSCGGGGGGGGGGAIEGNQGRPSVLKAVPSAPPTVHLLNVQRHSQVDFVVSLCCLTLFAPPPAHKEGDQPLHWRVYSLGAVCQRQVDHQDAEVLVADDDAPADGGAHRRVVAQHCPHQQHRIYGQVDGKENRHQGAADPEKDGHHHVAEGEGVEDEDEDVDVEEEKLADEVLGSCPKLAPVRNEAAGALDYEKLQGVDPNQVPGSHQPDDGHLPLETIVEAAAAKMATHFAM
ncbi:hypothetical protein TYRP_022521 [Tyrophagus putrescentiae]|nr:hypothetical protein TYRP_022521 [Tyrophagus putrescentiae]